MRSAGSTQMGLGHREQHLLSGSPHGIPPPQRLSSVVMARQSQTFSRTSPAWPEGGVLQCTRPVPSR